jgi:hypothetical protein
MSAEDDARSLGGASTNTSRRGGCPQARAGAVERDAIGIEELRGHYYIYYGRHYQAMMYHKTTRKIADYVAQEIKSGKEMYRLIMDGQETTYKDPEDPGKDATPGQVAVYKMLYEEVRKDRLQYANDKSKVFRLIVGQCTTAMRQKLEADPDYKDIENKSNVVALLKQLKQIVYSTEQGQHPAWVAQVQLKKQINTQQESNESLEKFDKRFTAQLEVTEQLWGMLVPYKFKDEDEATKLAERNQFLGCLFLANVDRGRYKPVIHS